MNESYGFSKSSTWYCLNKLKEHGLVEFANREEPGKPLLLTKAGAQELCCVERSKGALLNYFSNVAYSMLSQNSCALQDR